MAIAAPQKFDGVHCAAVRALTLGNGALRGSQIWYPGGIGRVSTLCLVRSRSAGIISPVRNGVPHTGPHHREGEQEHGKHQAGLCPRE